jgi:hypothetical protein
MSIIVGIGAIGTAASMQKSDVVPHHLGGNIIGE